MKLRCASGRSPAGWNAKNWLFSPEILDKVQAAAA
jgi:hypothetical protein